MATAPRRTQAERREASQARLEAAAMEALVRFGVAGASTTEICRLAGLSQGALFQHYPSKQALLVAAVARCYGELLAAFQGRLTALGPEARLEDALAAAWAGFANPQAVATLELWGSCRTDPELRGLLQPLLEDHWSRMLALSATLLPPGVQADPQLPWRLSFLIAAIQGAAPGAVIAGDHPTFPADGWRRIARFLLDD